MGLLGSNFVRAMRRRGAGAQVGGASDGGDASDGVIVNVWNRTPARARALEAAGARAFDDPAEAVRGATRVHLTLSDDAAVDEVLERALGSSSLRLTHGATGGVGRGVAIVDHTTCSPAGTAARAKRWAERGFVFQHAPVFMGPQNALDRTGMMLASGDRAQFDGLAPELAKMTGKVLYLGPQPERAAEFKLFGNLFLMAMTAGIADLLALGKALGVKPAEAASLFESFNPGATMGARMQRIIAGDHGNPSWELGMARKDARLMLEAAEAANVKLALVPAIADEMDRWIARGHAHDDWTVIAKDALDTPGT
jgi:3-hydroxyisobutyrate dehydrogenase